MMAILLGTLVLVALLLSTAFGLTADSRKPGPWYPGLPDR
jgi:hypothetical protein